MTARLEPATAPYPDKVQAAFDRMPRSWMPPFRLFTTLARHPELFERFIRGAPSYLPGTKLSIRQREVLLDRVTARCGCEYEWGMRVHYFAGEAGLTAAQVSATVHGDADSACWEANDALLIRLADELHDTCDIILHCAASTDFNGTRNKRYLYQIAALIVNAHLVSCSLACLIDIHGLLFLRL